MKAEAKLNTSRVPNKSYETFLIGECALTEGGVFTARDVLAHSCLESDVGRRMKLAKLVWIFPIMFFLRRQSSVALIGPW